jgi:hypothetical protein
MNNKLALLFFVAVSSILWNSCSVTKRYHNRGVYIDFGFKNKAVESPKVAISKASADSTSFDPILETVSKTPVDVYTPSEDATENPESFEAQRNDLEAEVKDSEVKPYNLIDNQKLEKAQKKHIKKTKGKSGGFFLGATIVSTIVGLFFWLMGYLIINSGGGCIGIFFGTMLYVIAVIMGGLAIIFLLVWMIIAIVNSSKKNTTSEVGS